MIYKNHEGYQDPTSGQAMKGAHWEEHKPAKKVKRIYTVIELYKHCVLLKDEKGFRMAPSYIQLQSLMRGGD